MRTNSSNRRFPVEFDQGHLKVYVSVFLTLLDHEISGSAHSKHAPRADEVCRAEYDPIDANLVGQVALGMGDLTLKGFDEIPKTAHIASKIVSSISTIVIFLLNERKIFPLPD